MNILLKMAKLQKSVKDLNAQLAAMDIVGESGGGMIRVTASGSQRIKSVKIDPALLQTGDLEMLEDLLVAGLNKALEASAAKAGEHMRQQFTSLVPGGLDPTQLLK